ncbi:MAG: hypothetical protein NC340_09400 [Ruminococcus flavefaciens]|nr:hypothetical protein [Ruminococcus flavefaciens]MCM1230631.1 hypothetical protein [Ruminococcus flavefaciens]
MKKLIAKAQEDKTTLMLLTAVVFLCGIILGFTLSPLKNGISIANDNTIISNDEDDDDDDED